MQVEAVISTGLIAEGYRIIYLISYVHIKINHGSTSGTIIVSTSYCSEILFYSLNT